MECNQFESVYTTSSEEFSVINFEVSGTTLWKITNTFYKIDPSFTKYEREILQSVLFTATEKLQICKRLLPYFEFDWSQFQQNKTDFLKKIICEMTEYLFPPYYKYMKWYWRSLIESHSLLKVLEHVAHEIRAKGRYDTLLNYLDVTNLDHLKMLLLQEKDQNKKRIAFFEDKYQELLGKSSDDVTLEGDKRKTDEIMMLSAKSRYVTAWEDARLYQNNVKLAQQDVNLANRLKVLLDLKLRHNRLSDEVAFYLEQETERLKRLIGIWKVKYEHYTEDYDNQLTELSSQKELIENRMKSLVTIFRERADKMVEVKAYLEHVKQQEELLRQKIIGARRIQKWWRGYLTLRNEKLSPKTKSKTKK